ncbi:manganese/zinc/iron transport system permease protein [Reichenbachiella faecimaris]|uniref:Manganese/zinc/iron transport system permease protein n=1 Tax=Reichenbachiella faecimaris TaxID=692418 RepID=A0A1W2G5F2_REIFA|nr:metal ABC transporter permease [Reichenbachiella faecimaris]SMD31897.1 manganese/zinc/iron transport system permease protein [Reichenbachiella faecimaris]
MDALYIITAGSLVAITCGLLGCFLILRKMAMVGDAISHAVLPGIVLAFLISGSRDSVVMLLGAGVIGILTTVLIEFFHKKGNLQADASIGVTFTWLFALGVILISVFANEVDLDQDCVLHGEIAYVPLDLWITDSGVILGPRVLYVSGFVFLVIIGFIVLGYKELYLTTFDPAFATAIGVSTVLWHYLLMAAVSLTTVASFESVGAILVVALLIAPPATAYMLTNSFPKMLVVTALLGVIVSAAGYYLAVLLDGSIAGAMSTVAGLLFLIAFLFSPSEGIVSIAIRRKLAKPNA